MTTEMQKIHDGTIERLTRELASDLSDLVSSGDLTEMEANKWLVHKQDQWAEGLN